MNYVNDNMVHAKGYNINQVALIQLIKQNRVENKEDSIAMYITDEWLEGFENEGIIKYVKKKKKSDSDFSVMRLTKKGEELLEVFETPEITPGDDDMFNYLVDMYLKDEEDRSIGNKKKTRMYCAIFRQKLSLSLHEMYWLCYQFLEDYPYTKRLEYVFFNSNKNRYGKFSNNLEDSPLYQFLDQHRAKVEAVWHLRIENYEENFS